MLKYFRSFCAVLLLMAGIGVAHAQSNNLPLGLDALREWNLVVLGDLTSNSEVEGRTFVGGDLKGSSSNYNIVAGQDPSPNGQPALTVVGNVIGGAKNLNNGGGAVVGGNVDSGFNLNGSAQTVKVGGTISRTNVNQNTVESGLAASDPSFLSDLNQDKSALATSMGNLSADLGDLTANSTLDIQGNKGVFSAQPDADGVAVFDISQADLDRIGEIEFDLNGAETVIVNVAGTDITLNDNFLGGTQKLGEKVIWNFPDATSLKTTTAWGGSILAPKADGQLGNFIEGSAVFGNLDQRGELHLGTFSSDYPGPDIPTGSSGGTTSGGTNGGTPVPEPNMLLLFGLAIAGMIIARTGKRKSKA